MFACPSTLLTNAYRAYNLRPPALLNLARPRITTGNAASKSAIKGLT